MLVFEAFPIAGVVLSALILFMGCLNIFKYDSTTYNSIPTDPLQYSCALADEEDDEHDLNEPSEEEERKLLFFEIRNNTKNTTKDRLDHAAAIRQLVKRINIDANITKMVGSTIALSAALWGTLWQLSNRSNGHQVALYFFASNAIIWVSDVLGTIKNYLYLLAIHYWAVNYESTPWQVGNDQVWNASDTAYCYCLF
ncbi:hypothetical protein BDF19DRAFT_155253 [Syncephalis fuscata]|nr:hypothetical protein BDF19DRAFT_155253 [Syncephalis fuscata]